MIPTVPVKAAGWRMEPPVSVAVAPRQSCAATAEPEPPEPDEGGEAVCRLERVSFSYGDLCAVESRSLVVRRGEVVAQKLVAWQALVARD